MLSFLMRFRSVLAVASLFVSLACAASAGESVWIEAESFAERGAWKVDTQFTHKMGSAYLIAPGVCKPIGSDRTTVRLPRTGRILHVPG